VPCPTRFVPARPLYEGWEGQGAYRVELLVPIEALFVKDNEGGTRADSINNQVELWLIETKYCEVGAVLLYWISMNYVPMRRESLCDVKAAERCATRKLVRRES
jgi:hypothetical protein